MIIWQSGNQLILLFNDLPLFLISLLMFINTQIMQISYFAYLNHGMKGLDLN